MQLLELLSPARNLECGINAIDHGADAVYIGATKFGARAAAGNCIEDIAALCNHAHRFGAKVYVTVNTIIYDSEMSETIEMVRQLQEIGVDAILLQDMGLLQELRRNGVNIRVHASTQTDNRTAEKVRWLYSMDIRRVVLARELSVEEIATIHREVPEVELEAFVHGALCVSYSGQCYASQHCFSRSANRGECAQFCRMPFTLRDAEGRTIERSRHILSLKDMAQLDNMERLAEAGAISFKIEGRLKDSDYVKNVTAAYSEHLNEICRRHPDRYRRASMGRCDYTFKPDIKKSFNRGFTTYFADGRQDGLVSFDTPKALGEPVGRVKEIRGNSFNVSSTASFSNGDGLCFFDKDRQLVGFRVNKAEGNRLFPLAMPKELRPGTALFRNHDQAFQSVLTKPSAERKIEVEMLLRITGDSLVLTMTDESGTSWSTSAPYPYQKAERPQDENIRKQLTKFGNTIFKCTSLRIESDVEQPFIANSLLTSLRRRASESEERRVKSGKYNGLKRKDEECTSAAEFSNSSLFTLHSSFTYHYSYQYNAANVAAKAFYNAQGVAATSFERRDSDAAKQEKGGTMIMRCRYCIRAEMGYCTRNGKRAPWKEPLTLVSEDGKGFTLKFNCKDCEMDIMA